MKKMIIGIVGMLMVLSEKAQIMQDSTVQVVAYWQKGESYKYKLYKEEFKVVDNDTTWGDWSEEIFLMEVVDSTENGYVMKCQTLESKHEMENKELQKMLEPLAEKLGKVPLYISTNQHGAFLDIARWEEYEKLVDAAISEVKEIANAYFDSLEGAEKMSEEDKKAFDAIMEQGYQAAKTKQAMLASMEYITLPLYYHGARLDMNREYKAVQKYMSPWMQGETLDGEVTFNVHKANYENSWTTFHRTERYDAGQLMNSFMRFMTKNLPPDKQLDLKPDELPFVMVETYFDLDVHLDTGWPGPAYYIKTIQAGNTQKVKRWWMEMVFDD